MSETIAGVPEFPTLCPWRNGMPAHREIDSLEARVVGVLVEKELTTPDNYPLSLNALTAGCNQKSNRNPVLSLSEAEVLLVVEGLRTKGIVGASYPSSGRVERFHHSTREIWNLQPAGLAVVTELLLRGPQSLAELRTRASRMHPFDSLDALRSDIDRLVQKGFVRELSGSRVMRYMQLLSPSSESQGTQVTDRPAPAPTQSPGTAAALGGEVRSSSLEDRVNTLENSFAELKSRLDELAEGLL
ncbi:MAG: hypothetical protein CMJ89_18990 [Planctomycetes bacterium]|nr:hypothetical protein [Planctomycetota bacterium]